MQQFCSLTPSLANDHLFSRCRSVILQEIASGACARTQRQPLVLHATTTTQSRSATRATAAFALALTRVREWYALPSRVASQARATVDSVFWARNCPTEHSATTGTHPRQTTCAMLELCAGEWISAWGTHPARTLRATSLPHVCVGHVFVAPKPTSLRATTVTLEPTMTHA